MREYQVERGEYHRSSRDNFDSRMRSQDKEKERPTTKAIPNDDRDPEEYQENLREWHLLGWNRSHGTGGTNCGPIPHRYMTKGSSLDFEHGDHNFKTIDNIRKCK
jgi:hypothetical protein